MKLKTLAFVLTLWTIRSFAQEFSFGIESGVGFYNMNSFSVITEKVQKNVPLPVKLISNYPPYWYFKPFILFPQKHVDVGIQLNLQSTGSRISLKDYSGEYYSNSVISSCGLGFNIRKNIFKYKSSFLGIYIETGIQYSSLKLQELLEITEPIIDEDYQFTANSFYFEPGIFYKYNLEKCSIGLKFGYNKEYLRKDYKSQGSEDYYIPVKNKFTEFDVWDGMRLGVFVMVSR